MERGNKYDFSGFDPIFINPSPKQQVEHDELIHLLENYPDIRGVIIGDEDFNSEIIDKAANLKIISKWGQGMDNIDIPYANSKGIEVKNCPGLLAIPVADLAIGYILNLTRDIHNVHNSVKQGKWPKIPATEMFDKTAAIIGLGNIGKEIIIRLNSFGVNCIGYDPYLPSAEFLEKYNVIIANSIPAAIEACDFIFICSNLTKDNYQFVNDDLIDKMNGVFIVNVGRGKLIDEDALIDGLASGKIRGIAMDVYDMEPLPMDSPLRKMDNIIFGTHSAGQTFEAIERVNLKAIDNLEILKK